MVCVLLCSFGLTGCGSDTLKYQGHTVLMTAVCKNGAEVNTQSDYWISDHWTIYYDGTVEFHSTFNRSGKANESTSKTALQSVKLLSELLASDRITNSRSSIGNTWEIQYYDEGGALSKTISGVLNRDEALDEFSNLIGPWPDA